MQDVECADGARMSQDLDAYIALFVKLLASMNRTDALQWSLVMLGDIIIGAGCASMLYRCPVNTDCELSGKDEKQAQAVIAAQPWDALLK